MAARLAHLTLRMRLVVTMVALTIVSLVVASVVVNGQLESYLLSRVDQQLIAGSDVIGARLYTGTNQAQGLPGPPGEGLAPGSFPVGTYGALWSASGQRLAEVQLTFRPDRDADAGGSVVSRPVVTSQQIAAAGSQQFTFFTTPGTGAVSSYRMLLRPGPQNTAIVGIAVPLTDFDATLTRLIWLEAAVGLLAAVILAAITYFLVKRELQSLERMSQTAAAITAGDLSHRIAVSDPTTEVGQLGEAINVMLTRIEVAFAAQRASEVRLRQFVADASHELRTPLTSIRGYAEMFDRGASESPADLQTTMRRIEQESLRMSGLVDDMLLLARLDQERPLRREPVELRRLVADVVLDTQAAHPHHRIALHAAEPLTVIGDEHALRQAIGNLARNACVHTPAGTPIEIAAHPADGDSVITVVDHGPGIASELAPDVFDRFTRADTSRSRDVGGSGLGLSIVEAIVSAHGGQVVLSPTPGGGATFTLLLPGADR